MPQRSLCGLHHVGAANAYSIGVLCLSVACAACILYNAAYNRYNQLCLSVACAACIGKYSQNADRTFVDYAVSW